MLSLATDHSTTGKVLRGIETFDLDQNAIFDRIINLKFTRKKADTGFTIRSDYEIAKNADNTYSFITIKQKPSIDITYKQVGSGTAIAVQIRVSNLFFTDGDLETFTSESNPITGILVNIGYRNQFKDWPNITIDENSSEVLSEFYALNDFVVKKDSTLITSGSAIIVQVLDSYPEGNPPDRTVLFNGIVGNATSGLSWVNTEDTRSYFATNSNFDDKRYDSDGNEIKDEPTLLEKICFQFITKRFIKTNVIYKNVVDEDDTPTAISVRDYNPDHTGIDDAFFTDAEQEENDVTGDDRYVDIELENGLMPVAAAKVLGVRVIVSSKLREESKAAVPATTDVAGIEVLKAFNSMRNPSIVQQKYLSAQIEYIKQCGFPDIVPFIRADGSLLLCSNTESSSEVFESDDKILKTFLSEMNPMLLPAIYDRTVNGVRTLRFPFFGFLSTGQYIGFSSKYFIGSLPGFYYPTVEDAWYVVISTTVEFSTVADKNTCTVTATDAINVPGEDSTEETEEEEEEEVTRSVEWKDITITKFGNATGTLSMTTWEALADFALCRYTKDYWLDSKDGDVISDVSSVYPNEDGTADLVEAVKLLVDKNSALSEDRIMHTGIGVCSDVEYPAIKFDDIVKLPFLKE